VLPVLVLTEPKGEVLGHWLTHTVLLEIAAGAALAALMGYLAGKMLRWAERKETMERTSLLTISLALSLTVLGVTELLHLNGVLAAFVAGIVFNFAGSSDAKESQEEIQEAISRFFDLPIFVLLGMALPWEGWLELGWEGLLLVAAVLLFRRLPAVLALRPLLGPLRAKRKDLLFLGWFGPIGAAALYYAAFSLRETGIEEVWVVGSLVICASVVVHGVTATPPYQALREVTSRLRGGVRSEGCELPRTYWRSSEDLTRRPLVDSSYGRGDKTNRHNIRRCNACGTARREHRLRGAQGAGSPPFPEVGDRHATLCADRARSRGGVRGAPRLLQRLQRQVHGRGPRAPVLRGNIAPVL
jgi:hypothetical protein